MEKALWIQFWKTFPFIAIFPIVLFTLAYRWEMAELHEGWSATSTPPSPRGPRQQRSG
ncbi:hypothetical protein [Thioflavicoccus mobilis]|nr:hypothetical protein [Thioflavicoccus mobilis]